MSYLSHTLWPERFTPADDIPEPAPVVLHVMRDGPCAFGVLRDGEWWWSLDARDADISYADGHAWTREAAIEAGEEAAHRLGCVRVFDGWTLPPDQAYIPSNR